MRQAMKFFSDTPFNLTPDALRNVGVNFEVRLPDGSGLPEGTEVRAIWRLEAVAP